MSVFLHSAAPMNKFIQVAIAAEPSPPRFLEHRGLPEVAFVRRPGRNVCGGNHLPFRRYVTLKENGPQNFAKPFEGTVLPKYHCLGSILKPAVWVVLHYIQMRVDAFHTPLTKLFAVDP